MPRFERKHGLLVTGAAVIIALGIWLGFYVTWKEKEIDIGLSREAEADPFLAIKRLLSQREIDSQSLRSFSILDDLHWQDQPLAVNDTLILLNAHKMIEGQRLTNLLDWVERGGTVIISTDNPFIGQTRGTQDALFERFELELIADQEKEDAEGTDTLGESYDEDDESTDKASMNDDPADDHQENAPESDFTEQASDNLVDQVRDSLFPPPQPPSTETDPADKLAENSHPAVPSDLAASEDDKDSPCNPKSPPLAVNFINEQEPLLIDYSLGQRFRSYGIRPQAQVEDDKGLHLAQFEWGEGLVVFQSDLEIWTNQRVGCFDHAYSLWKFIDDHGKVWFLVNQEAPSLWTLIWRAAPYGSMAALFALSLWLWAQASRFGPILTRQSEGRRSLAEHIHASAMLLWRRQEHPYLVARLRDDLRQQLVKHYPHFTGWSEQEQLAHLQSLTSLSAAQIHLALFSDKLLPPQDFTEAVACLQTLRKNL